MKHSNPRILFQSVLSKYNWSVIKIPKYYYFSCIFFKKYFHLEMSEIIVFTFLIQMISLCSPSQKQIHLHGLKLFFIYWKCFHGPYSLEQVVSVNLAKLPCLLQCFHRSDSSGTHPALEVSRMADTWSVLWADKDYTPPAQHCNLLSVPTVCESASVGQALPRIRHSSCVSHREWLDRRRGRAGSVPTFLQLYLMHHTCHSCLHTKVPTVSH